MTAGRLTTLLRALSQEGTPSRRHVTRALAGLAVGGALTANSEHEAQAAVTKRLGGRCRGPGTALYDGSYGRITQSFVAKTSGILSEIRVPVTKRPGTSGNYIIQLVPVFNGIPAHEAFWVFAAGMIDDADVPEGDSILAAKFAGKSCIQGEHYAVVVSRLGGQLLVRRLVGGPCADGKVFIAGGERSFILKDPDGDMAFSLFVT